MTLGREIYELTLVGKCSVAAAKTRAAARLLVLALTKNGDACRIERIGWFAHCVIAIISTCQSVLSFIHIFANVIIQRGC